MAPELQGVSLVGFAHEVDIYSFGVLLYELFTGLSVEEFHNNTRSSLLRSKQIIKFPSSLPQSITKLITQCTDNSPSKRPKAEEIKTILLNEDKSINNNNNSTKSNSKKRKKANSNDNDNKKSLESLKNSSNERQNKKSSSGRNSGNKISNSCEENPKPIPNLLGKWKFLKFGYWQEFPISEQEKLEKLFEQYLNNKIANYQISISMNQISMICDIDFENYLLINQADSNDIYQVIRQRQPQSNESNTKFLIVHCGKAKESNLVFTIRGKPIFDTSDVIQSVTYYYCDQKIKKYSMPYNLILEEHKNEWITIVIDIGKPTKLYSTFQLDIEKSSGTTQKLDMQNLPLQLSIPNLNLSQDIKIMQEKLQIYKKEIPEKLKQFTDNLLDEILQLCDNDKIIIKNSVNRVVDDFTIYTGLGGIGYFLLQISQSNLFSEEKSLISLHYCKKILSICEDELSSNYSCISFYTGCCGIFALQALLFYQLKEFTKISQIVKNLCDISNHFIANEMFDKEILYGYSGYISCLLFIYKYIPSQHYNLSNVKNVIEKVFDIICDRANFENILFQNLSYLGAAHGSAGILFILLHVPYLCNNLKYKSKILNGLHFLASKIDDKGYFESDHPHPLTHWCHGSPGAFFTFLKAFHVFKDNSFLHFAKMTAEYTWQFGLLRKGFNLCHGIIGNSIVFFALYSSTYDEEYLYKGFQFLDSFWDKRITSIVNSYNDRERFKIGSPDHPISLMEGKLGLGCIGISIQDNPINIAFPGYYNDIGIFE